MNGKESENLENKMMATPQDVRVRKKTGQSRVNGQLFTEKINTSDDSFKHWKWAFNCYSVICIER